MFDLGEKGADPGTNWTEDERWDFLLGTLSIPTIGEGDTLGYLMENDKFIAGTPALQWASHGFHAPEITDLDQTARIHQFVDTSYNVSRSINASGDNSFLDSLRNNMGFWENENEKYPFGEDWVWADVSDQGVALDQDVLGTD